MHSLSEDDRKVLTLLEEGDSDVDVCRKLQISERSFQSAISRIEARAAVETNDAGRHYERVLKLRIENKLKALESRFLALMDILPQAVMVIDGRTGLVKEANELACKLFGYPRRSLIGLSVEALVPEEIKSVHVAYRVGFLSSVRKREMGYHPPISGIRSDGSTVEMAIALTASISDDDVMVVCTESEFWIEESSKRRLAAAE